MAGYEDDLLPAAFERFLKLQPIKPRHLHIKHKEHDGPA